MKTTEIVLTLLLTSISVLGVATAKCRKKRNNEENFNILLSIYKMNPLKHSKVFKAFSNRILLPVPDERRAALNYNINESREKENGTNTKLKIEEIINNATRKSFTGHPLHVDVEAPEKFDPGYFLSQLVSKNKIALDLKRNDDDESSIDDIVIPNKTHLKQLETNGKKSPVSVNKKIDIKIHQINEDLKGFDDRNNKVNVLNYFNDRVPSEVAETVVVK